MSGGRFKCVVTESFGLESVVRAELEALGIPGGREGAGGAGPSGLVGASGTDVRVEDLRVVFPAAPRDVALCNICLRTADRVLIEVGSFGAPDFDALYEGVRSVPWRDLLAPRAAVTVEARSVKSRLTAAPSLQSVTKKAIVDAMTRGKGRMDETGPRCEVQLTLRADTASLCIDTTGPGLHKRGYRHETGEAPLRENLAAALVLLSRWDPTRPFADPLCGSGTIAIEAAMIAAGVAPGLHRRFAAEDWPLIPSAVWARAREEARSLVRPAGGAPIEASDRDPNARAMAERNARAAGVADRIRFATRDLSAFEAPDDYGCIVCNPPYGERLGDEREAHRLYRAMGELYRRLPTWSLFALSASETLPRSFGMRASRNRKLYNGNIRCWYYQYFGPLPRGARDGAP